MLRVAGEPALRERLLAAGRTAIAGLSWAETAEADAGRAGGGGGRVSVSVVVVLHDSAGPLPALLRSLAPLLGEPPQLVVVDTGSRDAGPALARDAGAEVVELGGNPGFGAASNAGVERARHAVTVLLNPDCELLDGSLARLAAASRPAVMGSGCRACSTPTGRSSAPRTRSPAPSAGCCPR